MIRRDVEILAVIPARGGSKGIPRKNTYPLAGKPLLAYSIEVALGARLVTDVVVSTDDAEIREVALRYGAQAPFLRPAELATDTALAIPTVQHAVSEMERRRGIAYNYVAMLQPTAPLRTVDDLERCLTQLFESAADGIISVVHVDNWHPMKMKRFVDGWLVNYQEPPVENPPRQILPPVYMVNGAIYASRRNVLMNRSTFSGDRCLGYIMPAERSVNIDAEVDFIVAEYFLRRGQADGQ